MVVFKDVYITANDGKIQWPILDIERIAFDETSLTGVQFKEAVQMWMNRAPTNGPVWDNLDAALAEKGAEITWLKEYQNVHMTRIIELEDRIAELEKLSTMQKLEQHQGRDRADLMEKIRVLEKVEDIARDVSNNQASAILELKKKLEAYKKDSGDELSQAFAEVNRVLSEHKKRDDAAQERIKGLEYRLGLAQDRIAEIHPSGCVPPAKSKPKSRLKTDRVKKVKP